MFRRFSPPNWLELQPLEVLRISPPIGTKGIDVNGHQQATWLGCGRGAILLGSTVKSFLHWWLQPPINISWEHHPKYVYIYIQLYINISQIVLKINMSKTTDQFISNINPWNYGPPGSKWLQMYTTQRLDIPNADPNYGNLGLSWKGSSHTQMFCNFWAQNLCSFLGVPIRYTEMTHARFCLICFNLLSHQAIRYVYIYICI